MSRLGCLRAPQLHDPIPVATTPVGCPPAAPQLHPPTRRRPPLRPPPLPPGIPDDCQLLLLAVLPLATRGFRWFLADRSGRGAVGCPRRSAAAPRRAAHTEYANATLNWVRLKTPDVDIVENAHYSMVVDWCQWLLIGARRIFSHHVTRAAGSRLSSRNLRGLDRVLYGRWG